MVVFTLPSFPYVFKVIRDWFEPPKDTDRRRVQAKYDLVKYARPRRAAWPTRSSSRTSRSRSTGSTPRCSTELQRAGAVAVEIDGDQLVIRHFYIERRMIPLDLSSTAPTSRRSATPRCASTATRSSELAVANIFPGDMLLKNFGVTRYGRVVFYDYDELCVLTELRFPNARGPGPTSPRAAEPWFFVGRTTCSPRSSRRSSCRRARCASCSSGERRPRRRPVLDQERVEAGLLGEDVPYDTRLRLSTRRGEAVGDRRLRGYAPTAAPEKSDRLLVRQ